MRPTLLLLALAGCAPDLGDLYYDSEVFDLHTNYRDVEIRNHRGDLTILGSTDPGSMRIDTVFEARQPEVVWWLEDRTLVIETWCPRSKEVCHVDLTLEAPVGTAADISMHNGDLQLVDLAGDIELDVDAGAVWLEDLRGEVRGSVGAGSVFGTGLHSEVVNLEVTMAPVDLAFDDSFFLTRVRARTGDISLWVPEGAYDCDMGAVTGAVVARGIDDRPDAAAHIVAHTGAGNILLTGYDSGR